MPFRTFFILFLFIYSSNLFGQSIKGIVKDATTNEVLPFASVHLVNKLNGTVCNENGEFSISINEVTDKDTIEISFMGYNSQSIPFNNFSELVEVLLKPSSINLSEVLISPKKPTWYIKQAIMNRQFNYPKTKYQSIAYYNEAMKEDDNYTKYTEAVFKSNNPSYNDTSKSIHQLVLFKQADNLKEMQFMKDRMEREKRKRKKKAQKKGEDYDDKAEAVKSSFGGPNNILGMDVVKTAEAFLDSNNFNKYEYAFAGASNYGNHEVVVITFKSKRKIDHMRQNGKIYIDIFSDAIVGIDFLADFVIPTFAKPLLFALGLKIHKPSIQGKSRYRHVDNTWFPENFQWKMNADITKKYLVKKNEHASFEVEQILSINRIIQGKISSIPKAKQFNAKEKMPEQVYNDEGIEWNQINRIKLSY